MAHDTNELVRAFQSSKMTRKDFCLRRGIAVSALQYHLKKYRNEKKQPAGNAPGQFLPLPVQRPDSSLLSVIIIRGEFTARQLGDLLAAV